MSAEKSIQHKPAFHPCADSGFEQGRPVPLHAEGLPLEHQLLESLRGLDLDNDRDAALAAIARSFDKAEVARLAQVLDWLRSQLGERSAAWTAIGRVMSSIDSPLRKPDASPTSKIQRWFAKRFGSVNTKGK